MGLADKIKTVDDLKNFRHTNEFRKYKRFVNIVDENMLRNVLSWGNPDYVISPSYYNHASATHVEKWARAEIWGESKRTNEYVKDMLGLIRANEEKISKNEYYQHYLSTFAVTRVEPAKSADIDALRKILLTS
ncbi:RxLR effector protein [Phytophthora megakarya]|uniref:RxLR effector protein n=1 Tax=Phytophthora megakarya TaxID=4795 RepID=A0A225VRS3_9STRA|nr:RxLR effector protein [Phytophthora megakarya]